MGERSHLKRSSIVERSGATWAGEESLMDKTSAQAAHPQVAAKLELVLMRYHVLSAANIETRRLLKSAKATNPPLQKPSAFLRNRPD